MKKTFNFEPRFDGKNAVEVHVFYSKANYNYYNGNREEAGFYLSFQPGELKTSPQGYSSFSFEMFTSGFKIRVADGTRDNKKKCAKILEQVTKDLAAKAFDGDKVGVFEIVKQFKTN